MALTLAAQNMLLATPLHTSEKQAVVHQLVWVSSLQPSGQSAYGMATVGSELCGHILVKGSRLLHHGVQRLC